MLAKRSAPQPSAAGKYRFAKCGAEIRGRRLCPRSRGKREIAMLPIRAGDEATLKASGLRFRIVTEFHQRVEIQLLKERGARLDAIRRVAFGRE
jgi:hypothetical protein